MLDPASAIGLAASVVQLTGFAKRVLNDSHELYRSADGALVRNQELEAVGLRLRELVQKSSAFSSIEEQIGFTASEADAQLMLLASEAEAVTTELLARLDKLKIDASGSRWKSIRQAFASILDSKSLQELEDRLDRTRREIDTALLIAQGEWVERLQEKQTKDAKVLKKSLEDLVKGSRSETEPLQHQPTGKASHTSLLLEDDTTFLSHTLLSAAINRHKAEDDDRDIRRIVELLRFNGMPDRYSAIPTAFRETFQWIFRSKNDQTERRKLISAENAKPQESRKNDDDIELGDDNDHYDLEDEEIVYSGKQPEMIHNFVDWLQSSEPLYWVTGKPGAGKSTLMKFIYHQRRTRRYAQNWASRAGHTGDAGSSQSSMHVAAFFFWVAGSVMQRSKEGLLRTLLYHLLNDNLDVVAELFPERMQRCELFGSDLRPFSNLELEHALDVLLSRQDRSFLLFIDGLDEFGGETSDIADLVLHWATKPCVKLCVSSRPWTVFTSAFEDIPMLRIEDLTKDDILIYIRGKFLTSNLYLKLRKHHTKEADELTTAILEKASGVFLWVYVVVKSLLEGLRDGDSMRDMRKRLDVLPTELEELFDRILNQINPDHVAQASEIFQFLHKYPDDSTLIGIYVSETDWNDALDAPIGPYSSEEAQYHAETMMRRLYSRCKCFLEAEMPINSDSKIRYLHRTARDFLQQRAIWRSIIDKQPEYDAHRAAAVCRLLRIKFLDVAKNEDGWRHVCKLLTNLMFDEEFLQNISPVTQRVALVDNAYQAGAAFHRKIFGSGTKSADAWLAKLRFSTLEKPPAMRNMGPFTQTMFELAMTASWDWYVAVKVKMHPAFLNQPVEGQYILVFAVKKKLWKLHRMLLEHGADPDRRDGHSSAFEILLHQAKITMNESTQAAEEERPNLLRSLTAFIEHGADPKSCTHDGSQTPSRVTATGVIHLTLATMSSDKYKDERDLLSAAWKTASKSSRKRKGDLGLAAFSNKLAKC